MTILLFEGTHKAISPEVTVRENQILSLNLMYTGTLPPDFDVAWVERRNSKNIFKKYTLGDGTFCVFNVDALTIEIPIAGTYRIVRPNIPARYDVQVGIDSNLDVDIADPDQTLSTTRSDKDGNGIYTTITFTRSDATVFKTSVLSGGTSPEYTTRTETFYAADGLTETSTKVFTLTYDAGDLVSETLN